MSPSSDTTCPFCGAGFEPGSTECPSCDLPLFDTGGDSASESELFDGADLLESGARDESMRRRPRTGLMAVDHPPPRPEYTEGELQCVVVALNQAEAEMLEDMLRSEGIPCLVRRVARADVPDFLAAGRRELLVPERALPAARTLLRIEPSEVSPQTVSSGSLALALLVGVAVAAICLGLLLAFS